MNDVGALSKPLDWEKMFGVSERVNNVSREVEKMVDTIVAEVCKDLDDYVAQIDGILTNGKETTDAELEDFTLNLPTLLYYASGAQENLGIKEDVSRAVRDEVYNKVREKAEGTVADKNTAAELQSQAETIVNIVYARAYRKVKLRVESAYEMLNSVKKVLTRRISELELSQGDRGSR